MQTKTQLPVFRGKPIIPRELQETFPQGEFLSESFGSAVLEEYNSRVKNDFNDNLKLHVLKYNKEKDIVTGSSPFAVSLVNKIIGEQGLRTATQAERDHMLRLKVLIFRGTYEDTALVLRGKDEPNSYLAQDLIKQLGNIELPIMIPLHNVELRVDDNSPYGLAFTVKDNKEIIYAPILNENSGRFSPEDIDPETGLPKQVGEGNRYFHTKKSGLSGLYLYDLDTYSGSKRLDFSSNLGRVVVVAPQSAQKIRT